MVDHLRRLAAALDARPAELVGLLVLLVSGLLVTLLVSAGVPGRSSSSPPALVSGPQASGDAATAQGTVTVHVAGAVRRPGVVALSVGARVADAVAAAGGARPDAQLAALNLAAVVEDGQQVLVPTAAGSDPAAGGTGSAARDADGRIDLNRATVSDLEELPGIGPVLAARIVRWREEHGPFEQPGQLREVPGIGERTFQAMADLVVVAP